MSQTEELQVHGQVESSFPSSHVQGAVHYTVWSSSEKEHRAIPGNIDMILEEILNICICSYKLFDSNIFLYVF
jgi:hypothetical protein